MNKLIMLKLINLFAIVTVGPLWFSSTMGIVVAFPTPAFITCHHSATIMSHASSVQQSCISSRTSRTSKIYSSIVDDIEEKAVSASEAWDIYVTDFLPSDIASKVNEKLILSGRGDMACFRIGNGNNSNNNNNNEEEEVQGRTNPPLTRSRFVCTHPDLGMDQNTVELEYCSVLCVENADLQNCDPWPNVLSKIGIDLTNVGDIITCRKTAYLIVTPEIVSTCCRLLPKELSGTGIVVSIFEDPIPLDDDDYKLEDMDMKRLDKREQKRR